MTWKLQFVNCMAQNICLFQLPRHVTNPLARKSAALIHQDFTKRPMSKQSWAKWLVARVKLQLKYLARGGAKIMPAIASSVLISVTSRQWPCKVATSISFSNSMLIRTTHAKQLILVSVTPWTRSSLLHAPTLSKTLKPITPNGELIQI